MDQITLMLLVPDRARADVVLRNDRIYYRFATDSTEDEGELPGLKERFAVVSERIIDALCPNDGETPLAVDDVKVSVFVDNVSRPTKGITEQALARLVDQLVGIDDVFGFLQGFV